MESKQQQWDSDDIGDLTGRRAIVTGASSGIGYETARVLAAKGAQVVLAVRNLRKGSAAADALRGETEGARVDVMEMDLARLASVEAFAFAVRDGFDRLDLLINNAGVMIPPYGKTADGFELQMGTNHFGHFALTGHLLPLLMSTPGARIVNVSSMAHRAGKLDFNDLNWEQRSYNASRAYSDSKIANLYFTDELARRLAAADADVLAVAAHPGWTATELQPHSSLFDFLNRFFAQAPEMGALPTLRAALDPDAESGAFYGPAGFLQLRGYPVRVEASARARNSSIAAQLWEFSRQLTGVDIDEALQRSHRRESAA
ncbi:MAG: oxidoreductase [Bacteroidota bacterium]|nr:oxidoreductase [Bacteroidota bacterium]